MDPRQPRLFETLTLPNIAARCFVVRVADDQIRPDNIPAAGTAYNAATNKLPHRILQDIWGSYVYGWPIESPTDYSAFAFVPSLPTTPTVKPRTDETWGPVIDHTYYALRSAELPAVSATGVSVLGAGYSAHYVIEVPPPREMSGEVVEITVTTAATDTVTHTDKPVDLESGDSYTRTRTWKVAASVPSGADIGTDSAYTTVEQLRHRLWLSTTQPSSFVPVLSGSAITSLTGAKSTLTTDAMYWPPVLESYQFDSVMNPIDPFSDSCRFELQFTPKIRNGYSGPVKCLVKEWWQATEPNATERPEINQMSMVPVAIRFPGRLQQFSLEPTLHGVVEFSEPNLLGTITSVESNVTVISSASLVNRKWSFAATTPTDWPSTFVVFKSQPRNGGYYCEQRTFYRPDITGGSVTVSDTAFVLATHGWRDPPIDGTIASFP